MEPKKFTVKTWDENGAIHQETFNPIIEQTIHRVAKIEDAQIKNALKRLGWVEVADLRKIVEEMRNGPLSMTPEDYADKIDKLLDGGK